MLEIYWIDAVNDWNLPNNATNDCDLISVQSH